MVTGIEREPPLKPPPNFDHRHRPCVNSLAVPEWQFKSAGTSGTRHGALQQCSFNRFQKSPETPNSLARNILQRKFASCCRNKFQFCDKLCDRDINTPTSMGHAHHSHALTRCLRALRTWLGPETSKIAILRGYVYDSKKKSSSISLSQLWVCRYLCRNFGCVDISVAI